ncbi:MAG: TIGR04211 family SH3 domain-containing protein [Desulfobacterales bacterium]|nr:TIGR04211 family SH3 domain-containing protein [Desulfobacterales bacterium]
MRKLFTGIWAAALLIGLAASYSQAKTAYVSDMLILTFREGPGTNYSVLKTLKSNTPLTILEEENGFYKVTLASGDQGWVDKQFVVFETPKTQVIEKLNREKAELENRIKILAETSNGFKEELAAQKNIAGEKTSGLQTRLTRVQQENKRLTAQLNKAEDDFKKLTEASRNVTETLAQNKSLLAENKKLSSEITRLEKETTHLFRTGMIKWFLAGVGVLLLGWIIGQSVSSKRRRSGSLLD